MLTMIRERARPEAQIAKLVLINVFCFWVNGNKSICEIVWLDG